MILMIFKHQRDPVAASRVLAVGLHVTLMSQRDQLLAERDPEGSARIFRPITESELTCLREHRL